MDLSRNESNIKSATVTSQHCYQKIDMIKDIDNKFRARSPIMYSRVYEVYIQTPVRRSKFMQSPPKRVHYMSSTVIIGGLIVLSLIAAIDSPVLNNRDVS